MNKIVICAMLLITLGLSSCVSSPALDEDGDLTPEGFMATYTNKNRAADLSGMNLSGFISLNGLNGDTEIVNMNVSQNQIELLNVSEFSDLRRLVANDNMFNYFNDVKLPKSIQHINLANNNIQSLDGIENFESLISIDVSNNNLTEDDFQKLAGLDNIKVIYASGNDISPEFLADLTNYSARYLEEIKGANPTVY